MWEMLAELLQACLPDAEGTNIQKNGGKKNKKCLKNKNLQLLCLVFCNTPPPDHQQGLAWTSSSWVSFSRMTSKRANQLTRSKPNHERVSVACRTQHQPALLRPTGSLSNVLGTSQRCCSTSVPLPFAPPSLIPSSPSLLLCSLLSPLFPHSTPPLTGWSQLSVLPKSNSCCGLR